MAGPGYCKCPEVWTYSDGCSMMLYLSDILREGFGVLACAWHPHQPWLFTAGADGRAYLWA